MQERRREHRNRTFLFGQIAFDHRPSTMDCVVRNLSNDGAKLDFPAPVALPTTFDLIVREKGESRRARLMWCDHNEIGVAFQDAEHCVVVSIDVARRLRALEKESDRLARRVAQFADPNI